MTNYPKWKDGSVAVQSPSRSLRNRDRDQLLNLAMELVPGWWSWTESQENHIDDIGDSTNVLLSKTETNNAHDFLSNGYVTISTAWVDRRRTKSAPQKLHRSVKKDDQIASARSFSTSWTRRSSRIQNLGTDVSFRISVCSALVYSNMAELVAKKEEYLKRDFSIVWIHSMLIPSYTFEQFKATLQENTSISESVSFAHSNGLQFPSNAIQRGHPVQHFSCSVHRKGGDEDVKRRIAQ